MHTSADSPESSRATAREPEALHQALAHTGGLDTLLRDLTERAVLAVRGAAACSITVRRDDRLLTLAGSSGMPSGLDQRQYENGSGPCVDAAGDDTEKHAPDLEDEDRWPSYTDYALAAGVRSVLAVPLDVDGEADAALNLYAVTEHAFHDQRETARAFAARASEAINTALRIERERTSASDVRTALLSRSLIDQAVGILMGQERCSAQAALDSLRRASQNSNVKLRDLCSDLVNRVGGEGAAVSAAPSGNTVARVNGRRLEGRSRRRE